MYYGRYLPFLHAFTAFEGLEKLASPHNSARGLIATAPFAIALQTMPG
jgi:hypothetical protein